MPEYAKFSKRLLFKNNLIFDIKKLQENCKKVASF